MPISTKERGERDTSDYRYRVSIGPCTGWDTSRDPSTLADTALVIAENVRVEDGIVVCRGGQETVSEAADGSGSAECIYGLIEVEGGINLFLNPRDGGGNGMFDVFIDGLPTADAYVRLSNANDDAGVTSGLFAECATNASALPRYCFQVFSGKILVAIDSETVYEAARPEGEPDPTKVKLRPLFVLPTGKLPSSMHVIPGFTDLLYIGTTDGSVYTFDGATIADISPGSPFASRVILTSLLGVLYGAADHDIRRYVGGTWSASIALPAGSPPAGVTAFRPMCAVEYLGNLYIGGVSGPNSNDAAIIKVSTAGVATMGVVYLEGGSDSPLAVSDMAVFNNRLYYFWEGILATGNVRKLYVVEYNTSNIIQLHSEAEGTPRLGGRLYVGGGRFLVGYEGNEPTSAATDGPKLADISSGSPVLLADRATAGDDKGAYDMIAY